MTVLSERIRFADAEFATVRDFFLRSACRERGEEERVCDFTFGNPHEMPLPGLVEALERNLRPQNPDWFAYKASEPEPRAVVAEALARELGLPFEPEDIAMTQGAFAAIALAFRLLLTRMVVVNSPHNPTGRVYPREMLQALADLLDAASDRVGARIWLLSDEPYRRIRVGNAPFVSPAAVYPWTLIDYSYGKVLLAPGQRLGYLAISPLLPADVRTELRDATFPAQMSLGWTFPDALMQHAVPQLENVSIDLGALAVKRDRMLGSLEQWDYRMIRPEGTFYLWGEAPGGDALRFADRLAERAVFVMPGTLFERPRHFRISLTASLDMVDRALPAFHDVAEGKA